MKFLMPRFYEAPTSYGHDSGHSGPSGPSYIPPAKSSHKSPSINSYGADLDDHHHHGGSYVSAGKYGHSSDGKCAAQQTETDRVGVALLCRVPLFFFGLPISINQSYDRARIITTNLSSVPFSFFWWGFKIPTISDAKRLEPALLKVVTVRVRKAGKSIEQGKEKRNYLRII
uniref:Uncharacterized protein n=1 Tax=Anopheles maculatus TaxID=74869 RepID=A0A182T1D8_9DIPT